jgi:hypothetical protein
MVRASVWRLAGAVAGVLFVAMSALASFLYPQPPQIDSSPSEILLWVRAHRPGIEAGTVIGVFAAISFLVLGIRVRHWLDDSGIDPLGSLIGVVTTAFVAVYALGAVPLATLAILQGQGATGSPGLVTLLIDLNQILFAPGIGLAGVFLLAVGIALLSTRVKPAWLAWGAIGVGLLDLLEIAPALTFGNYHGAGWATLGWISFLGFLAMVLLLSVFQAREAEHAGTVDSLQVAPA